MDIQDDGVKISLVDMTLHYLGVVFGLKESVAVGLALVIIVAWITHTHVKRKARKRRDAGQEARPLVELLPGVS